MIILLILISIFLLSLVWQNKNGTGASWILKKIISIWKYSCIWKYLFFVTVFMLLWFICADWGVSKINAVNIRNEIETLRIQINQLEYLLK